MKRVFLFLIIFSVRAESNSKRIITLNPALTEIIFALGKGDQIVGTVDASDYPSDAKKIVRVGSYGKPNIERIVELKPDWVLTFQEGYDEVTPLLKRAKISLKSYESRGIDDFEKIVSDLAVKLDVKSDTLIDEWNEAWKSIPKFARPGSLMIQLEHSPLIVAGGDTFISQIISKCGFTNSFSNLKSYPTVSLESLHNRNVDLVVVLIEQLTTESKSTINNRWKSQKKKVLFYDPHHLSRLAPRLPAESKKFCKSIGEAI